MTDQLIKVFAKRAIEKTLPHLTILQGNSLDSNACNEWIQEFLKELTGQTPNQIQNHMDLLFIKPEEDKKNYLTEDFSPLFKFVNNKANVLALKIVIIHEADKITPIIANKLLKVLEEPPIELAVFLLNSKNSELLPTLNSRAISIRVNSKRNNKEEVSLAKLMAESNHFNDFEQKIAETNTKELLRPLISEISTQMTDFKQANDIIKTLKNIEQDIIFNNSKNSQKLKLYHLLREFFPHGH